MIMIMIIRDLFDQAFFFPLFILFFFFFFFFSLFSFPPPPPPPSLSPNSLSQKKRKKKKKKIAMVSTEAVAFLLTLGAGLATCVGALIAFFVKIKSTNFLAAALGFSAGNTPLILIHPL